MSKYTVKDPEQYIKKLMQKMGRMRHEIKKQNRLIRKLKRELNGQK